jgi:hypothetical protein
MILFHLQAEAQKECKKHCASSILIAIERRLADIEILALLHSANTKAEIDFWQSDTLRNI